VINISDYGMYYCNIYNAGEISKQLSECFVLVVKHFHWW